MPFASLVGLTVVAAPNGLQFHWAYSCLQLLQLHVQLSHLSWTDAAALTAAVCAAAHCKRLSCAFAVHPAPLSWGPTGTAGWGFLIWAIGSVGCGLSVGFWSLLAWRIIMGAGEASIINLTGPFIDDVAPPERKTMWFGILFLVKQPTTMHPVKRSPYQHANHASTALRKQPLAIFLCTAV